MTSAPIRNPYTFKCILQSKMERAIAVLAVLLKTGNPIHVLFYTVPFICDPLSCKPIAYTKEQYRYPPNLDLADFQGQS